MLTDTSPKRQSAQGRPKLLALRGLPGWFHLPFATGENKRVLEELRRAI